MLNHVALATILSAVGSPLGVVPISASAVMAASQMVAIEQQIATDTNATFERTKQANAVSRSWATALNISNCVADIDIVVVSKSRGRTTTSRQKAQFHLSRLSRISRGQGSSFEQELVSLNFYPDAEGKTPVRTFENGREKPFHYLRSTISISYQTAAAADRAVSNFGKLQQMCGSL